MGEYIKILAVDPETNHKERLLEDDSLKQVFQNLQDSISFTSHETIENPRDHQQISNKVVEIRSTITFESTKFRIGLLRNTYGKDNILFKIWLRSESTSKSIDDSIYKLKIGIKNEISQYLKRLYWQRDTQNQKFCTELYNDIHSIENTFRGLIIGYMLLTYGAYWFENKLKRLLQDKIKVYSDWYNNNYSEFTNVDTSLFNIQIDDLVKMLKKSPDKKDPFTKEEIEAIFKDYNLPNVGKKEIIEQITERTIWNVHFKELLGDQFENKWETLTKIRNMVAHNKPICSELYNDAKSIINEVVGLINNAQEKIKVDFSSKEETEISKLWMELEQEQEPTFEELYFEMAGLDPTPSVEQVLDEIDEHEDICTLIQTFQEFLGLENKVDEVAEYIDEAFGQILDSFDFDKSKGKLIEIHNLLYNTMEGNKEFLLNNYIRDYEEDINDTNDFDDLSSVIADLSSDVGNFIEHMKSVIKGSEMIEKFEVSTLCKLNNAENKQLMICVAGDLYPDRGNNDELRIEVYVDDTLEAEGRIERTYGDYELDEDNIYPHSVQIDELWVEISQVQRTLDKFYDMSVKYLDQIIDGLIELQD